MLDVVILEAAQHVDDGIDLADVGKELVAQAFALAGAFHQPRDVHEGELRGDDLGALADGGQLFQPFVRHGDLAHIGLDRAEGIVRGLRGLRLRESIEKRRLADIGQADDTAFETHGNPLIG